MKLEADRAYRRRTAQAKKKQEAIDLAPARRLQPQVKGIRYDNLRSAMAEEGLLRTVLREPALMTAVPLRPEQFSSPLLGRVWAAFCAQRARDQAPSLAALEGDADAAEMAHLSAVFQKPDAPVSDDALRDYIAIITEEYDRTHASGSERLLALAARKKEMKG